MEVTELQAAHFCFESYNSSCIKEVRSTAVYVVMYISAVAVVVLTVCGNLVVIISISHFKQLHTPTNFLLLSLAVADFLVGLTVMPFRLAVLIETCWYFGETLCLLYNLFCAVLALVSIYNVVCIAIDRYFAVCDALQYSTKITVNTAWSMILLNWFLSLIYILSLVYFNGNFSNLQNLFTCFGECSVSIDETSAVVDLLIVFFVPSSIMITLNLKIFAVARRHAKVISAVTDQTISMNESKMSTKLSKKSGTKAAKTLGIVVVVFQLCLSPYYTFTLIYPNVNLSSSTVVINFLIWLIFFNSSLNPIIYALFYPWFQKSVKLIVTLRICKSASSLINLFPENV
ncbi:TA13C protein, partial [Atractosteus spatula]|nr:TA13C protein [Atractosteus spatula]